MKSNHGLRITNLTVCKSINLILKSVKCIAVEFNLRLKCRQIKVKGINCDNTYVRTTIESSIFKS